MSNDQWAATNRSCWLYQHAGCIFALIGMLLAIGGCFTQEYVSIHHPQMKKVLWSFSIICAGMTGLMLGNMVQNLYGKADTDLLTSLGNRRYFYRRLTNELREIKETKHFSVLALVDVDNFKRINDTVGHIAGDQVLIRISNIFRENVGLRDSIIRWGGDEFAFIFSGSSIGEARIIMERIRKQINADPLVHGITISAGLAEIKEQMNIDQVLSQADYLLYKAKEIKNSVIA